MFALGHLQGQHNFDFRCLRAFRFVLLIIPSLVCCPSSSSAQRSLGLDVSAWQGSLTQRTWNRLHNNDNQDFVFIRSSRGGTTGYYNQSDPQNNGGQNTLSQRYDDPYFVQNIARATQAGLLAGSYHFSRPDILSNTGADEADHFIEMAGAWMRPGYLLPVHDLEAGDGFRSDNQLAQFTLDFSDRIYEVMGIRPAIYTNGNYANYVIGGASSSLRNQVVEKHPTLWSARWPTNPNVQVDHPSTSLSWIYGPWDNPPNPSEPWSFWQFSSTGDLSSYSGNLDLNVAQGGMEFLKDRLVPALWTTASDGDWSTLTNWNSGQAPIAPVQGPGQVPRAGSLYLPAVRLPTGDDTVILERSDANVTVTLSTGIHEIRKLVAREALDITGGSLTVNYVPTADSTPYSAQFSAPVSLNGGSLSVHSLLVDAAQTFSLGGTVTVDTLELTPHGTTPAKIELIGDVSFSPLDDAAAKIVAAAGAGNSGFIDLGGQNRVWQVSDGLASTDLSVEVPIINGGLTKAGPGSLMLSGANTYTGDTVVEEGSLSLAESILADTADIFLSSAGALSLDFLGTDIVDSLFIDGISQAVGTWGGVGSGADFTSPLISGSGLLHVSAFEAPIDGDFNGDGIVNSADMAQWEEDFGVNGDSDANNDGDSDGNDFLTWQANYGAGVDPLLASASIPEPSTAALVVAAMVIVSHRRMLK